MLDWSKTDNIAVSLVGDLYIWSHSSRTAYNFLSLPEETSMLDNTNNANFGYITSVKWTPDGRNIAVGISDGVTEVWDVTKEKCLTRIFNHSSAVSSLAWNQYVLTSGDKMGKILNHDLRLSTKNSISEIKYHQGKLGFLF